MTGSLPNKSEYKMINEWLRIYHLSTDLQEKTKFKTLVVTKMIPVVKNIARTIARRDYDPIEDLIQAGFIGLLKAIEKFSVEINDNFRVYAGYMIIGEMKHYLRDKRNMIKVPAYIQELTIRINNFTKDLTTDELASLTSDEVASALEVPAKTVDLAMQVDRRRSTISLDAMSSPEDRDLSYEEFISEDNFKERAEFEDLKIIFDDVVNKLPPEEKVIVDLYYKQDMRKRDIAHALLISEMAVSRRLKKSINLIAEMVAKNAALNQEINPEIYEDEN